MTTLQKEMLNAVGHNVEVHTKGTGKPVCGVCTNYTQPVDNDPEVAAIDVKVEGYEGIIEITEADIVMLRVTVLCPVVGSQVDGSTCCTICAVADREAKPAVLPEGVKWDAEQQAKCLACEYHTEN